MPETIKETAGINPTKIYECDKLCICNHGHKFSSRSVKLIPFANSSKVNLGELVVIYNDLIIRCNNDQLEGGFLTACPVCNIVHLDGFASCDSQDDSVVDNDANSPVERPIELG